MSGRKFHLIGSRTRLYATTASLRLASHVIPHRGTARFFHLKSHDAFAVSRLLKPTWPSHSTPERFLTISQRSSMSSQPITPALGDNIVGQSGHRYSLQQVLQDRGPPWGAIYKAVGVNGGRFVMKTIPQEWSARTEIYDLAINCPNVRLPVDSIPEHHILVFEYIDKHLLNLVQEDLSVAQTKSILKQTLQGIADLHRLGISHNDIKPNNILVATESTSDGPQVSRVLVTDLEDAVQLAYGQALRGAPLGNFMWRSPEAHAEGPMESPSDMFAFGIVCIYAMTKIIVFAVDNPELDDDDKIGTVLFRQMSYFAGEGGIKGLLDYLGDENPMREVFEAVAEGCQDVPREPFVDWQLPNLDDDFKDLVISLTNLDPRKRVTAPDVLKHEWFKNV